jgi:hypothetical protein
MLQIWNEVLETVMRFGREYGRPVALGVVLVLAGGVALRVVLRLLGRNSLRPPGGSARHEV